MKVGEVDWGVLRGAIVLLVLSLLISSALFYGGFYFDEQADRENSIEKRKLVKVRSQYQAIDDEQRIIETYLPQYTSLAERGIIGRERRLNWVETLRASASSIKLPSLRYALSPQSEYEAEYPYPKGLYKVYVSSMRLELGLLHEGDLSVLLRELNRNASGLFSVANCLMRRTRSEVTIDPKTANVNATCELRWFTIKQPQQDDTT